MSGECIRGGRVAVRMRGVGERVGRGRCVGGGRCAGGGVSGKWVIYFCQKSGGGGC